jgi:sialate O-acetylesterase
MKHPLITSSLALCFLLSAKADLVLAPAFSDHAVLQRDKTITIGGSATPGDHVTAQFHSTSGSALVGPDSKWILTLPAQPTSAVSSDLIIQETAPSGTISNTITLHDVLVGEVWLCSGQSNMEFAVYDPKAANAKLDNVAVEVASAHYPLIRQLYVSRKMSEDPMDSAIAAWTVCSPDTVGHFTAVGYFFARDIYTRLNVPVGIINSTWGGTNVESWMSPEGLESNSLSKIVNQRWQDLKTSYPDRLAAYQTALDEWTKALALVSAKPKSKTAFLKKNPKPRPPIVPKENPTGLFNGMINPLVPYGIRGFLWYQGENNAGRASEYNRLFKGMIAAWRTHFAQGDVPFYWVQLANFKVAADKTDRTWAFLREAQTQALVLPNTGQAITIDIGNPNNIHPGNKQEVGRRLALLAKNKVYGISVDDTGPTFKSAVFEGVTAKVSFFGHDMTLTAGGKPLQAFEIAGEDHVFVTAVAVISGENILVYSAKVNHPLAVRYAWHNAPEANLYSGSGLPAVPFRSDDWEN